MNLATVDLNLLVAFEALYETRNVTLAGQRLHRAQPSVSNALARLRTQFGDPLFARTADGMQPTARAHALMPQIALALHHIRQAMTQAAVFDPASPGGRCFTIAASDYADIVLLPHVVRHIRRLAPDVDLRVTALNRTSIHELLDQGVVDVAIGGHLSAPKRMLQQRLYDEDFVCIASRAHPRIAIDESSGRRRRRMDLATYADLPHALFAPGDDGSRRGVIDQKLDTLGRQRRVAATFAHIVALPHAVASSDLVATVARRVAVRLASADIAIHELPRELADTAFGIDMVHSRGTDTESASRWLRDTIRTAVKDLQRTPTRRRQAAR